MLLMPAQENGMVLDEEQLLFLAVGHDTAVDEVVDEPPVQDLALNVDNLFQADECNAFDSNVDEAPTAHTMFMANLSSADLKYDKIERKNLLTANDNLIVDCLSKEVFYVTTNSKLTVSRFSEMHDAHTTVQAHCLELEAELSKLKDKIQKDDHDEMTQLTPKQIFWSKDTLKIKSKALKEQTKASKPITALMVYPPNALAKLVPRGYDGF
nr:retrovirus-related Pol polyprotein from transposon TNT 1-94 [Tanacetum cinerariifolium]